MRAQPKILPAASEHQLSDLRAVSAAMASRDANFRRRPVTASTLALAGALAAVLALCKIAALSRCAHGTAFVGLRSTHVLRASRVAVGAEPATNAPKRWSLVLTPSDHYIWRDQAHFVSVVSDAGEWELDMDTIKAAWEAGQVEGSVQTGVEVFGAAPLYVVKDYVTELESYGLLAEARETAEERIHGGDAKDQWRQRDWKTLAPEQKEGSGGEGAAEDDEAQNAGEQVNVMLKRTEHRLFDGSEASAMKFKAYVELAADAARRFTPEEELLNRLHKKLSFGGPDTRAALLENISREAANRAVEQLEKAGFEAVIEKVATPAR